jgi:hypothetical protein
MSFTYRASRIIEDTLCAVDQADEIGGVEDLEEYVRMMMVLSDELQERAQVAMDRLIKEGGN